jgi:uncharacterized membrane protein
MTREPDRRDTRGRRGKTLTDTSPIGTSVVEENVRAIKTWERAILLARSTGEQLGDWISRAAASGQGLLLHMLWVTVWISLNVGAIRGVAGFDPFPFPLLTLTLSVEAIFLTLFVLASQNRMARQADQRSHLDLQIDLLAEREMTAVLQLLQDIVRHLDVETSVTPEELRELMNKTDVQWLATRTEELAGPSDESPKDAEKPESRDDESSTTRR